MPKAKPTQVIVHRIELQEKERDMLEAVVAGNTVRNVVLPAAVIAGVGSASYIGYKTLKQMHDWGEDVFDKLTEEYENDPKVKAAKLAAEYGPAGGIIRGFKFLFGN